MKTTKGNPFRLKKDNFANTGIFFPWRGIVTGALCLCGWARRVCSKMRLACFAALGKPCTANAKRRRKGKKNLLQIPPKTREPPMCFMSVGKRGENLCNPSPIHTALKQTGKKYTLGGFAQRRGRQGENIRRSQAPHFGRKNSNPPLVYRRRERPSKIKPFGIALCKYRLYA